VTAIFLQIKLACLCGRATTPAPPGAFDDCAREDDGETLLFELVSDKFAELAVESRAFS
jgi:hypothetical protein